MGLVAPAGTKWPLTKPRMPGRRQVLSLRWPTSRSTANAASTAEGALRASNHWRRCWTADRGRDIVVGQCGGRVTAVTSQLPVRMRRFHLNLALSCENPDHRILKLVTRAADRFGLRSPRPFIDIVGNGSLLVIYRATTTRTYFLAVRNAGTQIMSGSGFLPR
jgi:hypothetical protein